MAPKKTDAGINYQQGITMTTPEERTRALVWAGGFLIEIANDETLPLATRQRAVVIARHFPTVEELSAMALLRHETDLGIGLSEPTEEITRSEKYLYGSLRYSTRLSWPEE